MVDTEDLKSSGCEVVRVQISSMACLSVGDDTKNDIYSEILKRQEKVNYNLKDNITFAVVCHYKIYLGMVAY